MRKAENYGTMMIETKHPISKIYTFLPHFFQFLYNLQLNATLLNSAQCDSKLQSDLSCKGYYCLFHKY